MSLSLSRPPANFPRQLNRSRDKKNLFVTEIKIRAKSDRIPAHSHVNPRAVKSLTVEQISDIAEHSAASAMQIIVNGQNRAVVDGTTLAELLSQLDLQARHVAVEINMELVPRAQHAEHRLADGDQLEVVTLVGGG